MKPAKAHPLKILVVNNNRENLLFFSLAASIVFPKAAIKSCTTASASLDYLFKAGYNTDLVLLDLNIGELSGKAFISLIMNHRNFNGIPLIVLSKLGLEEELLRLGAAAFYRMPLDFNELMCVMEKIRRDYAPGEKVSEQQFANYLSFN